MTDCSEDWYTLINHEQLTFSTGIFLGWKFKNGITNTVFDKPLHIIMKRRFFFQDLKMQKWESVIAKLYLSRIKNILFKPTYAGSPNTVSCSRNLWFKVCIIMHFIMVKKNKDLEMQKILDVNCQKLKWTEKRNVLVFSETTYFTSRDLRI